MDPLYDYCMYGHSYETCFGGKDMTVYRYLLAFAIISACGLDDEIYYLLLFGDHPHLSSYGTGTAKTFA
eukprot:4922860-Pleurochrysis_carterae.AAC.1